MLLTTAADATTSFGLEGLANANTLAALVAVTNSLSLQIRAGLSITSVGQSCDQHPELQPKLEERHVGSVVPSRVPARFPGSTTHPRHRCLVHVVGLNSVSQWWDDSEVYMTPIWPSSRRSVCETIYTADASLLSIRSDLSPRWPGAC